MTAALDNVYTTRERTTVQRDEKPRQKDLDPNHLVRGAGPSYPFALADASRQPAMISGPQPTDRSIASGHCRLQPSQHVVIAHCSANRQTASPTPQSGRVSRPLIRYLIAPSLARYRAIWPKVCSLQNAPTVLQLARRWVA